MKEIDEFAEPELYDVFNNNCICDVLWYIEQSKNCTSVLELGVGTGRIAIPLAQEGHEVWGLDNSADMLRLLKQKMRFLNVKGIHIVEQNMCNLKIDRIFDMVIIPFCTFNFLLSLKEQKSTLLSLKDCLNSNSVVIFELMTPQTFSLQDESLGFVYYRSVTCDSKIIDIYVKNSFDVKNSILKQNRLFKIYDEYKYIGEKNLVMKNRLISLEEFEKLLNMCGYKIQNMYGDFNNNTFDNKSKSLIVIAREMLINEPDS